MILLGCGWVLLSLFGMGFCAYVVAFFSALSIIPLSREVILFIWCIIGYSHIVRISGFNSCSSINVGSCGDIELEAGGAQAERRRHLPKTTPAVWIFTVRTPLDRFEEPLCKYNLAVTPQTEQISTPPIPFLYSPLLHTSHTFNTTPLSLKNGPPQRPPQNALPLPGP